MSLEAKLMLRKMYDVFNRETGDRLKAWDRMIDFIAVDHKAALLQQLGHKFDFLLGNRRFSEELSGVYDPAVLRTSLDDDLGDIYRENFTRDDREPKRSKLELITTELNGRPVIIDREAETGQRIISAHQKTPDAIFFAADPDIRALRIAQTNGAIHDIPGHFLLANHNIHELDFKTDDGRFNWRQTDQWYGPTKELRQLPRRGDKAGVVAGGEDDNA